MISSMNTKNAETSELKQYDYEKDTYNAVSDAWDDPQ